MMKIYLEKPEQTIRTIRCVNCKKDVLAQEIIDHRKWHQEQHIKRVNK